MANPVRSLFRRGASPAVGEAGTTRRGLLSVKSLYFVFFAAQGVFFTFINVYYASIGLTGTQIGLVNTVAPLVAIFSGALWGMLSDRTSRTRLILMFANAGTILAVLALSTATTVGQIVPIVAVFALFNSALMPLVDSTTLALLGSQRERYGAQRIWGSIGFIITSSVMGFILEGTGLHFIFIAYALLLGLHLLTLTSLPNLAMHVGGSVLRGLGGLVRQPRWLLFAASIFLIGIAQNGMGSFLSVTVHALGGSDTLVGLSWTVAAISELPTMAFGSRLLRRFGTSRLLAFAFTVYAVRMVLYSLVTEPGWIVAINLLGGTSFALYWICAVTYASELAPANLKATSQGLLMTLSNLAGMAGAVLSGWLFDTLGPHGLFQALAAFCLVALAVFAAGQWQARRQP